MKKEMIKLLLSHEVISDEDAAKLDSINDETIEQSIKELGFGKTEHITKEKILPNLETEYMGKEILCFRKLRDSVSISPNSCRIIFSKYFSYFFHILFQIHLVYSL